VKVAKTMSVNESLRIDLCVMIFAFHHICVAASAADRQRISFLGWVNVEFRMLVSQ
jgi:hypothetical protein